MNEENLQYMREAIRLATESAESGGGPFGAIVVKNGQVVGRGTNRVTTWNDPTAHAEVVAIRDACKNLGSHQINGCTIYTSCEPCPMCLGAIYWARPQAVYFSSTKEDAASVGFDDAFIYRELEIEHSARSIPFHQILHDEAAVAFQAWGTKEDRNDY